MSEHARAPDDADESREQMLLRAATHIKMTRVQCILYQHYVAKAMRYTSENVPHRERTYTFVVAGMCLLLCSSDLQLESRQPCL